MSKKNDLVIISSPDCSIYELEQYKDGIALKYSGLDKEWTNPGRVAARLFDTGNGLVFTDPMSRTRIELDYCQASMLRALLHLTDDSGTQLERLKRG